MENKIELGIYAVVRTAEVSGDEFVDYGLPFCAIDDRAACGMVREALKKDSVFNSVNVESFFLHKIGYFYPASVNYPLTSLQPTVVACCSTLVEGGEDSESQNV